MRFNVNTILILALGCFLAWQGDNNKRATSIQIENIESKVDTLTRQVDSLNLMHPWRETKSKKSSCVGTQIGKFIFGGYKMAAPMYEAMVTYSGPKVSINSCFRSWSTKSRHFHGKAIDIKVEDEVLRWLVSEAGTT